MNETTPTQYSTFSTLYLAFELSNKKWKLGFTIGLGQKPRERERHDAPAYTLYGLTEEEIEIVEQASRQWGQWGQYEQAFHLSIPGGW